METRRNIIEVPSVGPLLLRGETGGVSTLLPMVDFYYIICLDGVLIVSGRGRGRGICINKISLDFLF